MGQTRTRLSRRGIAAQEPGRTPGSCGGTDGLKAHLVGWKDPSIKEPRVNSFKHHTEMRAKLGSKASRFRPSTEKLGDCLPGRSLKRSRSQKNQSLRTKKPHLTRSFELQAGGTMKPRSKEGRNLWPSQSTLGFKERRATEQLREASSRLIKRYRLN